MIALALALISASDSASLTVRLQVVSADRLALDVTTVDASLGAYRVAVAVFSTGEDHASATESYLVFSDAPEPMEVTYIAGRASFELAPDAMAFRLTGPEAIDLAALRRKASDVAYAVLP